jgi:hypothetical protein
VAAQPELGLLSEQWAGLACRHFAGSPFNRQNLKNIFMLQSIKRLYETKLEASDGDIGRVKDFYFDDQTWAVRYVIADTGSWLTGRQVLISPHAFRRLLSAEKALRVKLTRKQIEDSPSIASHKSVSRQYEEEYHRYYGWPNYWEGNGFPILELSPAAQPAAPSPANIPKPKSADAHLRSTQAVNGYQVQASDGLIGHVCDFRMDGQSWAIRELTVKIGHRFSGKEVQVPSSNVSRISYDESTIFVNMTREAVENGSPSHSVLAQAVA